MESVHLESGTSAATNDMAATTKVAPTAKMLNPQGGLEVSKATAPTVEDETSEKTVFYLAYGSNLSAETFLGVRGIKPLSQQNVHCPTLTLTFDLPGIPYLEPCFANTRYSDPTTAPPELATAGVPLAPESVNPKDYHKTRWTKGVVGVVYEVTQKDFKTIIATEGGGASYRDIKVPCHPLPKGATFVPEVPEAEPIIAHTLFCPPREGISRPDPDYAQPSPRYLNLITSGAGEHCLPDDYREYLAGLRAYRVTSFRQMVGRAVLAVTWVPIILGMIKGSKHVAGKDGRVPKWYGDIMQMLFRGVWATYDMIYEVLFGDGERTEEDDKAMRERLVEKGEREELLPQFEKRKRKLSIVELEQDVLESQMA